MGNLGITENINSGVANLGIQELKAIVYFKQSLNSSIPESLIDFSYDSLIILESEIQNPKSNSWHLKPWLLLDPIAKSLCPR